MHLIIDGDVCVYTALYRSTSLEEQYHQFDQVLRESIEMTFSTEYTLYIGGSGNYRIEHNDLYKANRTKPKPPHYHEMRKYSQEAWGAILVHGQEADDAVSILARKVKSEGKPHVISSIDKDLKQIPGPYYNQNKRSFLYMTEDESDCFTFEQMMTGDSTDNIFGLFGIGEAKAKKFLNGVASEDRLNKVIAIWKELGKDTWEADLIKCANGVYIRRKPNETITSLEDIRRFMYT